jgi:hypothetical protein
MAENGPGRSSLDAVLGETRMKEQSRGDGENYPGRSPISAILSRVFSSKLPQNRHPGRSASQIDRVIRCLVARSRRTPAILILPMLFRAFHHRARTWRPRHGLSLEPRTKNLLAILLCPALTSRSIPSSKTLQRPGDGR